MRKLLLLATLFIMASASQINAQTIKYMNALSSAGALSTTDTIPICQNSSGCGTGVPLLTFTPVQLDTFMSTAVLTLTNKTMSGASNTFSNIPFTNSVLG